MTEPTPGPDRTPDSLSDVERATRIEQLLVSGLDEYFAGRLDHAINVWTRVLFLDRANDRARAYIDRARRAQAERQRETEALVDQGLQAFDAGDVEQARRLLTSALEHGAPHEQALPVLHRIGLLASPSPVTPAPRPAALAAGAAAGDRTGALCVALAGRAAPAAAGDDRGRRCGSSSRRLETSPAGSTPIVDPAAAASCRCLAPRRPTSCARRRCSPAGRLPDALAILERIATRRSRVAEAQVLRGRMQQELLRAAGLGMTGGRRPDPPVKCPKCGYVGFEETARCRHCGYDFSFAAGGGRHAGAAIAATAAVEALDEFLGATAAGAPPPTDRLGFVDLPALDAERRRRSTPRARRACRSCSPSRRRRRRVRRWPCGAGPIGRAAGRPRRSCGGRRRACSMCRWRHDAVGRGGAGRGNRAVAAAGAHRRRDRSTSACSAASPPRSSTSPCGCRG